jgi:HEPN domain-containing protein
MDTVAELDTIRVHREEAESRRTHGRGAQFRMRKARKDFQRLAALRAKEAGVLAKSGYRQGAYYLGGLAVECALKACIAKKTKRYEFPADVRYAQKVYTHELTELLKLAELSGQLEKDLKTRPQLATNWGIVKGWNVSSRHETSKLDGRDMVDAVNASDGVLQWIRLFW